MNFSLDSFKKDVPEPTPDPLPEWVTRGSANNLALYNSVVATYDKILIRFESEKEIPASERKIVLSRIASDVGVDKSLLSKRRKPALVEFIESLNCKLETAWNKRHRRKSSSGRKLSKEELIAENQSLKRELKAIKNQKMVEYLESAIANELLRGSRSNSKELIKLKKLYNESLETIENLRSELRKRSVRAIK